MAEGEFALMQQHLKAALGSVMPIATIACADHDVYALLADAAAQQRDAAALKEYAPLAEQSAASVDHKLYLGIAHRALGVAHTLKGEYPQAQALLARALEEFSSYPAPWQVGRTLFELGELARFQKQHAEAHNYYNQALAHFEPLHAAPYLTLTRAALGQLG